MPSRDATDPLWFDLEVGCHVGVADAVAVVEGAHDMLSAFTEPALQVGYGFEGVAEEGGLFERFVAGREVGELPEGFGWGGHAPTLVGTR